MAGLVAATGGEAVAVHITAEQGRAQAATASAAAAATIWRTAMSGGLQCFAAPLSQSVCGTCGIVAHGACVRELQADTSLVLRSWLLPAKGRALYTTGAGWLCGLPCSFACSEQLYRHSGGADVLNCALLNQATVMYTHIFARVSLRQSVRPLLGCSGTMPH